MRSRFVWTVVLIGAGATVLAWMWLKAAGTGEAPSKPPTSGGRPSVHFTPARQSLRDTVADFFGWRATPVQPIAFSHRLHAGEYKIACLYCHSYARRSPVAGVPSMQLCMGCHNNIQSDHPEILKLKAYWERKEPVPWIRVYLVPDFVHFNHKRHVLAGVACQTCHGPVERMEQVSRVASLEMGWCVQCHRERKASFDCATCHY